MVLNTGRIGFFMLLAFALACPAGVAAAGPECVVLLHGLGRTEKSLSKMERRFQNGGFTVINTGYPSRHRPIQTLAGEAIPQAVARCMALDARKIHFVTHSMGGILVRYYLEHHCVPRLGRVVMLSPPNHGTEVVDRFQGMRLFRWITGPAGCQLGTGAGSLPESLAEPAYEVGIITGDRSINPLFSILIPGADDGTVSVRSAGLEGMKDFMVVHKTHPFIMNDDGVIKQAIHFIRNGGFERELDDGS